MASGIFGRVFSYRLVNYLKTTVEEYGKARSDSRKIVYKKYNRNKPRILIRFSLIHARSLSFQKVTFFRRGLLLLWCLWDPYETKLTKTLRIENSMKTIMQLL